MPASDNETSSASLTARQAAFVREYLVDLNATQAAIRAGYAADSAGQSADRLLKYEKIAAAVAQGKAQRASRLNIKQDDVLNEMHALATSRLEHYVITEDGDVALADGAPDNAMAAIQSVKKRCTVKANGDVVYDVEYLRFADTIVAVDSLI